MLHEQHHHEHSHSVDLSSKKLRNAFYIGILLNIVFIVVEAFSGWFYDSLALLSDAGHNLSDVFSLVLSWAAFKLAEIKSTKNFTYGYRKGTVLATLINAVILITAVLWIIYEAVGRFKNPQPLQGNVMILVAFIGIIVNGATAYLFMKEKETDLNVKAAYLHMAADALVSLGVVLAGVVILFTDWYWLDAAMSIVIAIVILLGTWKLLTESIVLSLDGVPENVNSENVRNKILEINEIKDFQHIHIWAISTTENALTGHLKIDEKLDCKEIENLKNKVRHELEHLNIQHATLETYYNEPHFSASENLMHGFLF